MVTWLLGAKLGLDSTLKQTPPNSTQTYPAQTFLMSLKCLEPECSNQRYAIAFFASYDRYLVFLQIHVINVWFLVSDTGFSGRISICWRAGKLFSCQHQDFNLS